MITKNELIVSMRHETDLIQHLASKVTADMLEWRPTPEQRSIHELLQYMPCMAKIGAENLFTGNWDHAPGMSEESEGTTLENFAERMDSQMAFIEHRLVEADETTARATAHTQPWGTPTTQAAATVDLVLKCFVAYRMQFFLYLKQCGHPELNSGDCWVGAAPSEA